MPRSSMSSPHTVAKSYRRLALERRLMFDGAVAVTADAVATEAVEPSVDDASDIQAVPLPDAGTRQEIYFVDANLPDLEQLTSTLPEDAEVVLLSDDLDGLEQIAMTLEGRDDIDAIHLLTHSFDSALQLGSSVITVDNVSVWQSALQDIGSHLSEQADFLIYGCNLAEAEAGQALIGALGAMLDADIAASDDITGAGGDWELEHVLGTIEAQAVDAQGWDNSLSLIVPPIATPDVAVVDAGSSRIIDVLANDVRVPGDVLTVTSASALFGTVAINADNTLTYTPNPGYVGVDTITYGIRDQYGSGTDTSSVVAVTVLPVSSLLTLSLPTIDLLAEDMDLLFLDVGGIQLGDGDINGTLVDLSLSVPIGTLTLTETAGVSLSEGDGIDDNTIVMRGSVADINAVLNGLVYTPAADYNGPVTLTLGVTDVLLGIPLTAELPIGIAAVADVVDDAVDVNENEVTVFNVLSNDTFENPNREIASYTNPAHGSVILTADGQAIYTPNADFTGTDSFTYTVQSSGTFETATVTLTITTPATAPEANNDVATTAEDTPVTIAILANDTDANNDPLTVTAANADNGSVTINPDGTITYTPNANFNGMDYITYTIDDGNGGTATATVTVTVNAVNDAPVASNLTATTNEDTAVVVELLAGASDVEGDALTVTAASAQNGSVTINPDGTITYTPNANFNGTDTLTYTIDDGNGGTATATVTVTMNAVNDAPVAFDDLAAVNEDTSVILDVLANDSDPEGGPLTLINAMVDEGSVVINADGTLTYTPAANFNGTATISYTVSDAGGLIATATATVTVIAVNDAPIAGDDSESTVEDSAVIIDVLANDSDIDGDPLAVSSASALHGAVVINPDGTLTYTPNANYHGGDTLTYTLSDGQGGEAQGTVIIVVTGVNDAPVATNSTADTNEDTPITLDLLSGVSDADGDTLTLVSATVDNGTVTLNANGTVTYTPNANFNGSDTLTYTVSDGQGGTTTATVAITVNPLNDAPVAVDDVASTAQNIPLVIDVLANDSDVDNDTLTVTAASVDQGAVVVLPDNTLLFTPALNFSGTAVISYSVDDGQGGTATAQVMVTVNAPGNTPPLGVDDAALTAEDTPITLNVLANDTDADGNALEVIHAEASNGSVIVNPDNSLTFTPAANFNGVATVTYTITDGQGGTDEAVVVITVTSVNDAPVVNAQTATTDEDTPVTVDLLAGTSDVDGDLLTVTEASAGNGSVVLNPDGTVIYTPNNDFNGTDTLTYTVSDGNGGEVTRTVTIVVNAINDAPVVGNTTAFTDEDTPVVLSPLDSATDVDGNALLVSSATAVNGAVHINPDGTLVYTPNTDFNGIDTVTFIVDDGEGGTSTGTVVVTVAAVNDIPTASSSSASTNEDTPVMIDLLANASDADGDPLTVVSASAPNGTLTDNGDGTFMYMPNPNFNGTDTLTYTVADGNGGTVTETVTITVAAVNDGPSASSSSASTNEDTPVMIDLLANASDADGDPLTVVSASAPNGTLTDNGDGTFMYMPNPNFNGTDTLTYTVADGNGGTVTETVTITVAAVNDVPTASSSSTSTNEDTPVMINLLANASDTDGDPLTVVSASAPNGTLTDNGDGTFMYMPNPNFNGTDTLTYTVADGNGGTVTETVTITVAAVNDAPQIANINVSTDSGTAVVVDPVAAATDADGDTLQVDSAVADNGSVVINPDGTLTYTPDNGFSGEAQITYSLSDAQGATVTGTITVVVAAASPADVAIEPVINSDTATDSGIYNNRRADLTAVEIVDYDPLLLDVVNGVKRLQGMANLLTAFPTLQALGSVQTLDSSLTVNSNNLVGQSVGNLNDPAAEPFTVEQAQRTLGVAGFSDADSSSQMAFQPDAVALETVARVEPPATFKEPVMTLDSQIQRVVFARELEVEALRILLG